MRILHLLASPYWTGPAENVALLALAQRGRGHDAWVAVDRKRSDVVSEEPIVPRLRALGILDESGLELSVKSGPTALWADVRKLRRTRVDVLHAHFTHDHWVARFGRKKPTKLVRSIHAARSLRASLPHADAYTVATADLGRALQGRTVEVLPALVAPEFTPPQDRAAVQRALGLPGAPIIGMISTFQASRRHSLAVGAFERVRAQRPDAHLLLVGDGGTQSEVRARVASAGLQAQVTFAGYQSGDAFVRHVQAMDEVWILGLGNDDSARAAAQARVCGARVIGVAEGALPSRVDELVHELTAKAVAEASLSGRRRDLVHPSNDQIAAQILELYGAAQ
jgi:L-malate glycosyltransferase